MNYKFVKRGLDVVGAAAGLVMALPVCAGIAAVLFAENKGSVFFTQERTGKDNKKFNIYKFKTMSDRCDKNGDLLPDAHRVTKAGRFLRRHGLDELPQLVNILCGEMSFVGPRPLSDHDMAIKDNQDNVKWLDKYLVLRHTVKPGLVSYYNTMDRGAMPSWDRRLTTDTLYIRNCSFLTDTALMCKAAKVVLWGRKNTSNKSAKAVQLETYVQDYTRPEALPQPNSSPELG